MKYIITKDEGKDLLGRIINRLSQVEVKGDSVEHMFVARAMLSELYESLKEIPDDDSGKEKEG